MKQFAAVAQCFQWQMSKVAGCNVALCIRVIQKIRALKFASVNPHQNPVRKKQSVRDRDTFLSRPPAAPESPHNTVYTWIFRKIQKTSWL